MPQPTEINYCLMRLKTKTETFLKIKESLHKLANNNGSNQNTTRHSHLLECATWSISFIVYLHIISKYSSYSEPAVYKLKTVDMDLFSVYTLINTDHLANFQKQRKNF